MRNARDLPCALFDELEIRSAARTDTERLGRSIHSDEDHVGFGDAFIHFR